MSDIIKAPSADVIKVTQSPLTFINQVKHNAQIVLSGTDEYPTLGLVRTTPNGRIIKVRSRVQLSWEFGHVWEDDKHNLVITAVGYDYLQRSLGASFFKPQKTNPVTGALEPNPIVIYEGHEVRSYIINMIGFYRNSLGNLAAIDSTLHYDLEPMFRLDVLKKWYTGKDWGTILNEDSLTGKDRRQPGIRHIKISDGIVLAVQLAHPDVLAIMRDNAQRRKFASRLAETIIRRNLIKKMVGVERVSKDLIVSLDIWPEDDWTSFGDIGQLAERLKAGTLMIEGEKVTVIEDVCEIDETDAMATGDLYDDTIDQSQPIDATPALEPTQAKEKSDDALKMSELRAKIRHQAEIIGGPKTLEVFDDCKLDGMDGTEGLVITKLAELLTAMKSAADNRPEKENEPKENETKAIDEKATLYEDQHVNSKAVQRDQSGS